MKEAAIKIENIKSKYERLEPFPMNELHRLWCATEAKILEAWRSDAAVHFATGVTRKTISSLRLKELKLRRGC